jgi:hypothetical protein
VPDIYALKVRINGVNYIYGVNDLGGAWLLAFTYHHSVLSIAVDLLGNNTFPVATPTFSPAGGSYSSGQWVTIQCATAGATIRYTLDGSEPILSSPVYTGPMFVNGTTTIKAKAYVGGLDDSSTASADYTVGAAGGEWLIYVVVAIVAIAVVCGVYLLMRSRSRRQRKVLDPKNWTGRKPYSPTS